jgi:hypothetical protein
MCMSTDGNDPLPLGTKSPAESIGRACSPTSRPGEISSRHDAPSRTRSLKARMFEIP